MNVGTMDLKSRVARTLAQPMNRAEFLKFLVIVVIGIVGIQRVVALLVDHQSGHKDVATSSGEVTGYGR